MERIYLPVADACSGVDHIQTSGRRDGSDMDRRMHDTTNQPRGGHGVGGCDGEMVSGHKKDVVWGH